MSRHNARCCCALRFSIFPLTLTLFPTGGEGILVGGSYTKAFGKLGAALLTQPILKRLLQPACHIPQQLLGILPADTGIGH